MFNRKKCSDKEKDYTELSTYETWLRYMRTRHVAHIKTNAFFAFSHYFLGISIILLAAIAGSSVFVGVTEENGNPWFYTAVAISIALSALTAMKTFLELGERAKIHHKYQADYGDLRHDIEKIFQDYINCVFMIMVKKETKEVTEEPQEEEEEIVDEGKVEEATIEENTNEETMVDEYIAEGRTYEENIFVECKDEIQKKLLLSKVMKEINDRMKEIDSGRPTIPQFIYNHARRLVRRSMCKEKSYSEQLSKQRKKGQNFVPQPKS